jgi:hypothetical protein
MKAIDVIVFNRTRRLLLFESFVCTKLSAAFRQESAPKATSVKVSASCRRKCVQRGGFESGLRRENNGERMICFGEMAV